MTMDYDNEWPTLKKYIELLLIVAPIFNMFQLTSYTAGTHIDNSFHNSTTYIILFTICIINDKVDNVVC